MKGKRGESYNLCASQTYQIGELLRTAIRLSGVKAEIRPVPRLMRPSDERIIFGSAEKIRKDTGWKPLLSIEQTRSEEHTSELQSRLHLVCRLLLEKKKIQ